MTNIFGNLLLPGPAHMHTETSFKMLTAMGELTREVIETVADRPGDSPARRVVRQQTTASTILSLQPRDPVETMLAGQCVIFDHLLRDGAHDTLRGQQQDIKLRARPQILATGKMFLAHLDRLERMRTRLPDSLAGRPPVEQADSPVAETSIARDIAASAPADGTRPPADLEPAEPAIGAADVGAPSHVSTAIPVEVHEAVRGEINDGAPSSGSAGGTAIQAEPPIRAHHDPTRQATTSPTQPAVSQAAVARTTADSPQIPAATPSGGPGTDHPRPNMLPDPAKPGTQTPPLPPPDRSYSESQRNFSRADDALALLAASHGVSPAPGLAGQTSSRDGQPSAAGRAARVEEPV
jgi:hypothetical protein